MTGRVPDNPSQPPRSALLPASAMERSRPAGAGPRQPRPVLRSAQVRGGSASPSMTLDHVVDPVQLARFLELSGCSAPTGRVSSSATLSSFSVPATTVVRAIDLATAEAPLAFAAVLGE